MLNLDKESFEHSIPYWTMKEYKKGAYFNQDKSVCQYMGFIINGAFRPYIIDEKTGEKKNVFLYSSNGFVVTFKSFVNQVPCDYHTQAITDATVIGIGIRDLMHLYSKHDAWESFGRLLAQEAFQIL